MLKETVDKASLDRSLTYRPEIDGLRAVAVLSVFAFHLGVSGFPGGFVGVDVFFVISGYLITNLIRKEIAAKGSFRLSRFYLRRARRLLPALYVTLFGSSIAAAITFKDELLGRFAGSLFSAAVSFSNVFFWRESGYFDALSTQKPLLHTWSLGVEEQFYLFWPIFMIAVMAKRRWFIAPLAIALAAAVSLAANMHIVSDQLASAAEGRGFSAIFYLTPFRVFEFAIGALVLWAPDAQGRWAFLRDAAVAVGLAWLAFTFTTYSETMIFPSVNALGPAVASALVIWGGSGTVGRAALANKPAVYIGKISYSLYLVHWPLIVFYKIWRAGDDAAPAFGPVAQASLLALGIAGAAVMHRYVETPFRHPDKGPSALSAPAFGLACALIAFAFVIPSAFLWQGGGYFGSRAEERNVAATAGAPEAPTAPAKTATVDAAPPTIAELRKTFDADAERQMTWRFINTLNKPFGDSHPKILVIGDSQAADFMNLLRHHPEFASADISAIPIRKYCQILFDDKFYTSGDWRGNTQPPRGQFDLCQRHREEIAGDPRLAEADRLVLAFSWFPTVGKYLPHEIAKYKNLGPKEIFIVGKKNQFAESLAAPDVSFDEANKYFYDKVNTQLYELNRMLKEGAIGATFLDLFAAICHDGRCLHFTEDGKPVFYEANHFSEAGEKAVAQTFGFLAIGDKVLGPMDDVKGGGAAR